MTLFNSLFNSLKDIRTIAGILIPALFVSISYLLGFDSTIILGVLTLLFCFTLINFRQDGFQSLSRGLLMGSSAAVVLFFLFVIWSLFTIIVEWDFLAFYVYAKAGASGIDFYNPDNFKNILAGENVPFIPGYDFQESILKVGVSYPPTSMLFLAPMGYLHLNDANIAWRIFITLFLLIDIILIYRTFKTEEPAPYGLLITILFVLLLKGSYTTIYVGQTVFVMVFLLLMMYRNHDNWKAGVFLALAVTLKPIAAVWGLYYLIKLNWKVIASFSISGLLIVLLTISLFGLDNFIQFFTSNPTSRIPELVYTDPINHSLIALVFRTDSALGTGLALEYKKMIVYAISALLIIITLMAANRLKRVNAVDAFLILLPLSLLIYPNCSLYYAPMLLPVMFRYYLEYKSEKYFPLILAGVFGLFIFSCYAGSLAILIFMLIIAFRRNPVELIPATRTS